MKPIALVHIPKTGGTSIRVALSRHFGLEQCHFHYGELFPDVRAPSPAFVSGHLPASAILNMYPAARLVACIREPMARLRSLDRWLANRAVGATADWYRQTRPSLPELARADLSTLVRCLRWYLDVHPRVFAGIVRLEQIDEDWPLLLRKLGLPALPLGHLNSTTVADGREYDPGELAQAKSDLRDEITCYERYGRIGANRLRAA